MNKSRLAVWLNFADGTIAFDNMVDTNDDHVPDSNHVEADRSFVLRSA